ncbi:cation-translocating P-type ATPase [Pseudoduganella aquatica]|uniref:P-type Cu(+) transporter n=1 Tax=Pseudoduganella aquatica TaxID=2660641 RepID=A0A7X4HCQ6_9BURK|nr:cation-translocating P-type ATPase [Pseudoduganella aquatica]MYN07937.1 HAD-IC family P-type ATPase [Pseudoduganella aquatica]
MALHAEREGLTAAEAAARLRAAGPNALPASPPLNGWRLLLDVASEPMFLLLAACGAVYLMLGDRNEALMLLGFVGIVVGTTFFQQRRTERSLSALRDLSCPRALVVRDGKQQRIAGRELVVGDLVLLAEGDRVPADIDLLSAASLSADESMLTGESVPVMKRAAGAAQGEAEHRVYSGTLVTQGAASGVVVATGAASALGRIGASLAAIGGELTPIQSETRAVVKAVASGGIGLACALALAYWALRGDWLQGLLAGLTLAMAILPEELPVILTLFLGLGAWRLGREQVLARSIPAIELLGATSVLCVDKTGTLTVNRMEVAQLWSEQSGYDCRAAGGAPLQEELHGLLEYAVLASHRRAFDPMESAIVQAGARLLADTEHLHADWELIDDYPLSPGMLAMSRVWRSPDRSAYLVAAKGAPEAIADLCHLAPARAAAIAARAAALAGQGLRVVGVAQATFPAAGLPDNQHVFEFSFLGLVALHDPVRPEVPAAVAECQAAGMRVVMITGDHPATAQAIAREAGIGGASAGVLSGTELAAMDDAALQLRLRDTAVFCRIAPEQKLRLVQGFRRRGDIVAMTGDGVNDAPALKAASIGVAMGARGSDVAREAAALVLLKDDFSSLLLAVRHGRRLFANLRKAIVFIVAVHVPIVGLSIVPVLLGWPMLLMPVHIMFLQLVIDPACSIVFEAEPLEPDAMTSKPRRPDMRLFDREILLRGLLQGGGLLLLLVGLYLQVRWSGLSDDLARTSAFVALVLADLGLIYSNRTWSRPAWAPRAAASRWFAWISLAAVLLLALVLSWGPLRSLFAFAQPGPAQLAGSGLVALLSVAWFELVKWARSGIPSASAVPEAGG